MGDIERYAMTRFNRAKHNGHMRTMLVCWAAFHRHADWMNDESAKLRADVERMRGAIKLALDEMCCMGPTVILSDALTPGGGESDG